MAINDISLTAGMRSNLISLQGTVDLLNRTQERLSSGKKVNSALDNPTAYFTAKSHLSDASDLAGLKDSMLEAIQTVKKADAGVTAVTGLIASAKAIAVQAKSEEDVGSGSGGTDTTQLTITTDFANNEGITIGGHRYTADSTLAGISPTTQFWCGGDEANTALNLANLINNNDSAHFTATVDGATLTITQVSGAAIVAGDVQWNTGGTVAMTETIGSASASGRTALAEQYDEIMGQIADLVSDSGYGGVNLLGGGTEVLTVDFGNSHSLDITGFDGSGALSGTTSNDWSNATFATAVSNINGDIDLLDAASEILKTGSQNLSNYLSIVTTRNDWSTATMNVLVKGADNLTLADMNEEGANMLMLQTRQALGTTALSLSSQASQSVLRLFG